MSMGFSRIFQVQVNEGSMRAGLGTSGAHAGESLALNHKK